MTGAHRKIYYTKTDEAPALATLSWGPIVKGFLTQAGLDLTFCDISLAARILAQFPDLLADKAQEDHLKLLGQLVTAPDACIIKLPNISASVPQLQAAIKELQAAGFKVPDYPESPQNDDERTWHSRYSKVLGSAVNPVLREGNSDRRVAGAVKAYAQKHPHSMGVWHPDSKTRVAHMSAGDFFGTETSHTMADAAVVNLVFTATDGSTTVLKEGLRLAKGEIIDTAVMSRAALAAYFDKEIAAAYDDGLLLSLHLKATMMKVSDPVIFGQAVTCYYQEFFAAHGSELAAMGVDPQQGLGAVIRKLSAAGDRGQELLAALDRAASNKPDLAMVDSDKGITNLHVPSDIIIDASMPAAIRVGGKMWDKAGALRDTVALIPDRSYARIYQDVIDDCKQHGNFDVATMGNVANVGLMAKKAEEYGSHDKTFIAQGAGTIAVVASDGKPLLQQTVAAGDIFRMCQTKDVAVKDWVKLGVNRAKSSGAPAYFWLDPERAHDRELQAVVTATLSGMDTSGATVAVMSPSEAMVKTLARVRAGQDTISVTGNVLRDYLTDLFPILELGTSAKMLSIVPLLEGGGLYETGAGGSAPKHVQQFVAEGHLRWDSMGEFLALGAALVDLADKGHAQAGVLGRALDAANTKYLMSGKAPSRKAGELDTRGCHFYLALYWAEALAEQSADPVLQATFAAVHRELAANAEAMAAAFLKVQGQPVDLGGYYFFDEAKGSRAMRPVAAFNKLIDDLVANAP